MTDKKTDRAALRMHQFNKAKLERARKKIALEVRTITRIETGESFYKSEAWLSVRYRALVMWGGHCQCCGARAAPDNPLHVDHIKPRSKFPELALDIDNLQVLCEDCNIGKGTGDKTDWRP